MFRFWFQISCNKSLRFLEALRIDLRCHCFKLIQVKTLKGRTNWRRSSWRAFSPKDTITRGKLPRRKQLSFCHSFLNSRFNRRILQKHRRLRRPRTASKLRFLLLLEYILCCLHSLSRLLLHLSAIVLLLIYTEGEVINIVNLKGVSATLLSTVSSWVICFIYWFLLCSWLWLQKAGAIILTVISKVFFNYLALFNHFICIPNWFFLSIYYLFLRQCSYCDICRLSMW